MNVLPEMSSYSLNALHSQNYFRSVSLLAEMALFLKTTNSQNNSKAKLRVKGYRVSFTVQTVKPTEAM